MKQPNSWSAGFTAVVLALTLAACAGGAGQRSTGEYIDDGAITAKVKTALARSEDASAMDVKVETYEGVVQLSGFADSERSKRRAEEIARGVEGVTAVKNDLRVKPDGGDAD